MNLEAYQRDTQFETYRITRALPYEDGSGYDLGLKAPGETSGGMGIFAPLGPIVPQVGSAVALYGRGFGSPCRGMVIDGHVFYYRTEQEDREQREREVAEQTLERWEAYKANTAEREAEIKALPEVFQKRLRRFTDNAPATAWDYQGYELAVCHAALAIAETCATREEVIAFSEAAYEEQITRAPRLGELGLSGNQFGMATRLAYHYRAEPDNVWKEHAAISPLTGCEEAGCPPVALEAANSEEQRHGG